jgi:hypothetical protein
MHYNELSATAQERVREQYINSLDYEWWDCVYEDAIEKGKELGFYIDKIYFSGFWSQGDGASWEGQVDVGQWLKTHTEDSIGLTAWVELINNNWASKHIRVSTKRAHYLHSGIMSFDHWEIYFYVNATEVDKQSLGGDSILKDMPISAVFNLIMADPHTKLKSEDDICEAIAESARDYADEIYKKLQKEYEWLCSELVMVEHFEANDINFDEEGEVLCFGTTE